MRKYDEANSHLMNPLHVILRHCLYYWDYRYHNLKNT